ncbi:GNAT family N-acetyltransferase [Rossellomorea sp. AcN35-11]|nr:GNAT family N-acetyltransferase [Rossellomorea aquimaris]WJV29933.1 GNAT family N-acetyltransferase [Rossellomorea sp. AcN35-11]
MQQLTIQPPVSLEELARYIEKINNQSQHHIGYCGEKVSEILDSLENDFSDLGVRKSFLVVLRGEEIVGALGFDVDLEDQSAEAWGPFVNEEEDGGEVAGELMRRLLASIDIPLERIYFFINERNKQARKFLADIEAEEKGGHLILKIKRDRFIGVDTNEVQPFSASFKESFSELHQSAFPDAYYHADDILDFLGDPHKDLLIIKDGNQRIKGYSYIEANPEHGEGDIEFIAVSPLYRKQGIGTRLVKASVQRLFHHDAIADITLCVSKENDQAIHLYQAAGFDLIHGVVSFEWRVTKDR